MKLAALTQTLLLLGTLLWQIPTSHAQPTLSTPEGTWVGSLQLPNTALRLVVHIKPATAGTYTATLDSPDQGARGMGIPVERVIWQNDSLQLDVTKIGGTYVGKLNADSLLVRGKWRQGGQQFDLHLQKTDAASIDPKRPQNPKKPYPYREEEVVYTNPTANIKLAGTFTVPSGKGPFPAVLLITGSGPQNRNEELMGHQPFLVLADYLTRRGIAVLRVDDRGVGSSTGEFGQATSKDFASDVQAGVNYLKTRQEVNPKQIGLVGHSEGGLIAPMVAAESKDVAFIVLMAGPGVSGEQIIQRQTALLMQANGANQEAVDQALAMQEKMFTVLRQEQDPEQAQQKLMAVVQETTSQLTEAQKKANKLSEEAALGMIKQLNSPWFRYFINYNPVPVLRQVKVPVLAINGEKDLQVPPQENLTAIQKALTEAGNKNVQTKELPGLNHLFQQAKTGSAHEYAQLEETFSPTALQIVGDWISKQVKSR